jgi:hypothetical protein
MERCGKMVAQNDSRRCVLEIGHEGECSPRHLPFRVVLKPALKERIVFEDDPYWTSMTRGDGMVIKVPTWVGEAVQYAIDHGWEVNQ